MAWQDKPTDAQIMYLRREYDAILLDKGLEFSEVITEKAAHQIATRKDISAEINNAEHGKIKHPGARRLLEEYFRNKRIEVKL